MAMNFSEWLQEELRIKDLSQADLARKSGITPSQISRIISGNRGVGEEALTAIAYALGYPPEEIFRKAGLLPEKHQINDRAARLAYRIGQLPAEEQEFLDAVIDGLLQKRGKRSEEPNLPPDGSPKET